MIGNTADNKYRSPIPTVGLSVASLVTSQNQYPTTYNYKAMGNSAAMKSALDQIGGAL